MRHPLAASAALLVLAAAAAPAAAQRPAISFGVAGGPTFPVGDLAELVDAGWHAQAAVHFGAGIVPLGLRAELLYQDLDGQDVETRQLAAFLSAVLSAPGAGFSPYVLAGAGVYDLSVDGPGLEGGTHLGVNAGAGVDIGMVGYALTLEARFHHLFTEGLNQQTLPISIGLRF